MKGFVIKPSDREILDVLDIYAEVPYLLYAMIIAAEGGETPEEFGSAVQLALVAMLKDGDRIVEVE